MNPSAAATWCSLLAEIFLLLFFFDIIDWWVLYVCKHHNLISSFKTEQFFLSSIFQFDTSCHNYQLMKPQCSTELWAHSTVVPASGSLLIRCFSQLFIFSHLHLSISRVSTHFKQNSIFNVSYVNYEDTIFEIASFMIFAHEPIHGFNDKLLLLFP